MTQAALYVVDASVFVSDAQPWEAFHADSSALLTYIANGEALVITPAIMPCEVAASIARQTGDPATARQFVYLLQQLPYLEVITIDPTLGNLAADVAAQQRIRGCDALYVALAQMYNTVLITLDQEQRQRVPPSVVARTPAEELCALQNPNS